MFFPINENDPLQKKESFSSDLLFSFFSNDFPSAGTFPKPSSGVHLLQLWFLHFPQSESKQQLHIPKPATITCKVIWIPHFRVSLLFVCLSFSSYQLLLFLNVVWRLSGTWYLEHQFLVLTQNMIDTVSIVDHTMDIIEADIAVYSWSHIAFPEPSHMNTSYLLNTHGNFPCHQYFRSPQRFPIIATRYTLHDHIHTPSPQKHFITTKTLHHHKHIASEQTLTIITNIIHHKKTFHHHKHTPSPQTSSITRNTIDHHKHTPSPHS